MGRLSFGGLAAWIVLECATELFSVVGLDVRNLLLQSRFLHPLLLDGLPRFLLALAQTVDLEGQVLQLLALRRQLVLLQMSGAFSLLLVLESRLQLPAGGSESHLELGAPLLQVGFFGFPVGALSFELAAASFDAGLLLRMDLETLLEKIEPTLAAGARRREKLAEIPCLVQLLLGLVELSLDLLGARLSVGELSL